MEGQVSHELEVNVPASKAWEVQGSPTFASFLQQELKDVFVNIERLHGDGYVGTLQKLVFMSGALPGGITTAIEKITKIDKEKRMKEKEVVEGGYLDLGFNLYRYRFEILEKEEESCILKSTIEYHLKQEAATNAKLISLEPFAKIAQATKLFLEKDKKRISFWFGH